MMTKEEMQKEYFNKIFNENTPSRKELVHNAYVRILKNQWASHGFNLSEFYLPAKRQEGAYQKAKLMVESLEELAVESGVKVRDLDRAPRR